MQRACELGVLVGGACLLDLWNVRYLIDSACGPNASSARDSASAGLSPRAASCHRFQEVVVDLGQQSIGTGGASM